MNATEAKTILLLYRPGTADAEDPQIAEALALAKSDPELSRWLEAHVAQQQMLRAKFKQIVPPAGLKEQIISEHAAARRAKAAWRRLWVCAAALLLLLGTVAVLWQPPSPPENTLAIFQRQMARIALGGYEMDLLTNAAAPVRAYLAQHHAPANLNLPPPLQQAALTGCAVRQWQGAAVSLVCFRTGRPLPAGKSSDLWLFVVDGAAITNAPTPAARQVARVNRLMTVTWMEGGKLYFLGVEGQEADIRRYL